jgi:hypothetical protein
VELQAVCPDDGADHSALPDDPLVAGVVVRALAPTPLTAAPRPSQCAALRAPFSGKDGRVSS